MEGSEVILLFDNNTFAPVVRVTLYKVAEPPLFLEFLAFQMRLRDGPPSLSKWHRPW